MAAPATAPPTWAALSMLPPLRFERMPKMTTKPSHLTIACVRGLRQPPVRHPTTSAAAMTPGDRAGGPDRHAAGAADQP